VVGWGWGDEFEKFSKEVLDVLTSSSRFPVSMKAVEKVRELSENFLKQKSNMYPEISGDGIWGGVMMGCRELKARFSEMLMGIVLL
jgi:hypothetical protein